MSKARDLADSAQEINILDGKSFLDEDNLASDSATGIASQQSIKAYVDGITTTNITSTGALNSGSITSGFGNIDNGSSTITTTGAISGGSFVIGSADINENDLESIDGITAGTVAASKAVVVNANKDITGFRNLTATGTISGTLSGAIASTTTATTQAESDDSTKVATTAYVTDKITTLIGGAPSTLNDLNELAAAINDDANYNSTLTTALATKLPLAGGAITGNVTFGDNNKAIFGAGSDLQIYHDGSNSYIKDAGQGNLTLTAGNFYVNNAADNQNMISAINGGATSIMYSGSTKLSTTSTGIQVTGNIANTSGDFTLDVAGDITFNADGGDWKFQDGTTGILEIQNDGNGNAVLITTTSDKDIRFLGNDNGSTITALTLDMSDAGTAIFNNEISLGDTKAVKFGASNDFQIFHDGSGFNQIIAVNDHPIQIKTSSENMIKAIPNGAVELYHNNAKKFETTSSGVTVTGNLAVTGTVDGRDVASDGSKLDGVASSANNYSHPTGNGNNHIPSGGSTDQILKYSSAGTAQWGDASGGSRVLLNRSVMSSTSSYTFTAFNSSLYDRYVVEFEGVVPSNGGSSEFRMLLSDDSFSSELPIDARNVKRTSVTQSISSHSNFVRITNSVGDSSKNYGCNVSGEIRIMNPNGAPTTSYMIEGSSVYRENSTANSEAWFTGTANNNTSGNQKTINAMRFKFNSGNLASGIFRVYGVLK